jgi:hypothetical protein
MRDRRKRKYYNEYDENASEEDMKWFFYKFLGFSLITFFFIGLTAKDDKHVDRRSNGFS